MAIELPEAITRYFAADRTKDAQAVVRCFSEGAVVKDEGRTHAGLEAIRRWKAETSSKFTYTVEPFAMAVEGERTVVTSRLEGDFPGSPTDLRYAFVLSGEKIVALEITP